MHMLQLRDNFQETHTEHYNISTWTYHTEVCIELSNDTSATQKGVLDGGGQGVNGDPLPNHT